MPRAVIIGAGPAGLTAAYELLTRTNIKPVIYEASGDIGGLSKTLVHNGNRIDIGGHRFFTRSERVKKLWLELLPLDERPDERFVQPGGGTEAGGAADGPEAAPSAMLKRHRISRIYFLRKFFEYPVRLSVGTLRGLGLKRVARILASYARARLRPIRDEQTLESLLINRFGRELYHTFFKDYTRKVWGVGGDEIHARWGAQRIKGLSISRTIWHAFRSLLRGGDGTLGQQGTETSLIERFLYPALGPGQLWEEAAHRIRSMGGELHLDTSVEEIKLAGGCVSSVGVVSRSVGTSTHDGPPERVDVPTDYVFSSMPVKHLVKALGEQCPGDVRRVAAGLQYRDFITVGLLVNGLTQADQKGHDTATGAQLRDNWVYVQEPDVRIGRIQIFNNWSPFMVADPGTIWLGLEYFCQAGDDIWSMSDEELSGFAAAELEQIEFARAADVMDSCVIRTAQAYPAYFGTYDEFQTIRDFTDRISNLFLIGRNGMHSYNNADRAMLTAMVAVDTIVAGVPTKEAIWQVNAAKEHDETD